MPANQAESRSSQDIKGVSGSWSSRGANLAAAGLYGRLRSLVERLLAHTSELRRGGLGLRHPVQLVQRVKVQS
jgi:hypothetical protein